MVLLLLETQKHCDNLIYQMTSLHFVSRDKRFHGIKTFKQQYVKNSHRIRT